MKNSNREQEMIEEIVSKDNMKAAYDRVVRNKSCAGVDGMEVSQLRPYLKAHWHTIKASILNGDYRPRPVNCNRQCSDIKNRLSSFAINKF